MRLDKKSRLQSGISSIILQLFFCELLYIPLINRCLMHVCCIWYDFVSYSQLTVLYDVWPQVVYDTILSAIHNAKHGSMSANSLYMIRFCQLFTTESESEHGGFVLYMIRFCQLFTTPDTSGRLSGCCIWYDFVSYSQLTERTIYRGASCIWYDFVSYSQHGVAVGFECFGCM